jgi:sodium-dependent phosphate transporter 1-B
LEQGLKALPLFYGMTIFINLFSIVHNGPSYLYLDEIQWWASLLIAATFGISTSLAVWYFVIPYKRKVIKAKLDSHKAGKL